MSPSTELPRPSETDPGEVSIPVPQTPAAADRTSIESSASGSPAASEVDRRSYFESFPPSTTSLAVDPSEPVPALPPAPAMPPATASSSPQQNELLMSPKPSSDQPSSDRPSSDRASSDQTSTDQRTPLTDIPLGRQTPHLDLPSGPYSPHMEIPMGRQSPLLDAPSGRLTPLLDAPSGRMTPHLDIPTSGRQTPLMDLHYQITSGRQTPIDWNADPLPVTLRTVSAMSGRITPLRPETPEIFTGLNPRRWTRALSSMSMGSRPTTPALVDEEEDERAAGGLGLGLGGGGGYFDGARQRNSRFGQPSTPDISLSSPSLEGKTYEYLEEEDDALHDPADADMHSGSVGVRGVLNVATLMILAAGLFGLFAGYPVFSYLTHAREIRDASRAGFNIGGTNGTGQIPDLNIRQIIDPDTPPDVYSFTSTGVDQSLRATNTKFKLVFSDEFNEEGRTFWPGDDPFWEAVDMWYGATLDYEWYSPEAVNTTGGKLVIALEAMEIHNLNFRSGMLQSWNKLCYQGGYIEFSMLHPGDRMTQGYWPALWMMGNLGRPGYLGSTEGLWPYSYDSCDSGIMPKQLYWNMSGPLATVQGTGQYSKPSPDNPNGPERLSHLPGMRFPSCTCPGEDHPGPNVNTGRSAAELDVIESQIQYHGAFHTYASQSMQTAPFDKGYFWHNETDVNYHIYNRTISFINDYVGGPLQECTSGLTQVPDDGYEENGQRYVKYGVEYQPDWEGNGRNAYVTWYLDGKPSWTVFGSALGPRADQDIGQRLIPVEPMSIIMNLGMATGFQPVHFTGPNAMTIPTSMKVDYVRLYQLENKNPLVGCDPPDHPTLDYIKRHPDLYQNRDIVSFNSTQHKWPRNKLTTGC
ncbi:hypothetical protein A4X09_0g4326 [Tilletia walkeri]|uniref:GH16 domain-containing protein n=1 Tax=Tilletia walkeri TaxID=117179 RepID=A0A8X7T4P2_9BASI|nr:hypothetical protein A4X09_0g4326 [Tilletia walkeri]